MYQAPVSWYVHNILLFMNNMSIMYPELPPFKVHRMIPYGLQLFGHFILRSQRKYCIQFRLVELPDNYSFVWGVGNNPFGALDTLGFDCPCPQIVHPDAVYTRANAFLRELQASGQCGEVVDEDAVLLLTTHQQYNALRQALLRNLKVSATTTKETSKKEFDVLRRGSEFHGRQCLEADKFVQQYEMVLDKIHKSSLSTYKVFSRGDSKLLSDVKVPLASMKSVSLKPTLQYQYEDILRFGVPMNFPNIGKKNDPVPSKEEVELSLTYGYHVNHEFVTLLLGLIDDEDVDKYKEYVNTFCGSIKICSGYMMMNKMFYTARIGKRKYCSCVEMYITCFGIILLPNLPTPLHTDARKHIIQLLKNVTKNPRQHITITSNFTNTPKLIRSTSFSEVIQKTFNLILPVLKILVSPLTNGLVRDAFKIEKLVVTRYESKYMPTIKKEVWIHRFPNGVYDKDPIDPTFGFHVIGATTSTDVKWLKQQIMKWIVKKVDGTMVNYNTFHQMVGRSSDPSTFLAELFKDTFYINDVCIRIWCHVAGCKATIHKQYTDGESTMSLCQPRRLTRFENDRICEGEKFHVMKQMQNNVISYALVHFSPHTSCQ